MKSWVKLAAAVAVGAAVWGGLLLDQHFSEKEQASKKQEVKALDFETKDVLKISMQNKNGKFVFQRDSNTANWKMTEPQGPRPDQDSINNLVSAIQSTTFEQQLEDVQKTADAIKADNLAAGKDYGFEKPRASIALELSENKESGTKARTLKLWLGGDVGIGSGAGAAFNALSVYAVATDRKGLLVVGHSIASTVEKDLKDFRSKVIGDFSTTEVKEFLLSKNDGTQLTLNKVSENGQNIWKVSKPKEIKADNNQVGLYLDSFTRLRADKVTESASISEQNKAALGLSQPNATLILKGEGGKIIQTIQMGLTKESLYLTMADGAVGSVELSKFADLAPGLKFFRDRRVLSGLVFNDISVLKTKSGKTYQKEGSSWYQIGVAPSTDPKKPNKVAVDDARKFVEDWEFATAEDVLDADQTINLSAFGLDKPLTGFTFASTDEKKQKFDVLVGNRVPKNEKAVYVKRADKPEVFIMETKWLDVLARLDQGGESPQAKK
ncbi:DUF4340 domain-containing protein [bacterium]|nr:DUF4340 domain-containing protein [bacterium]